MKDETPKDNIRKRGRRDVGKKKRGEWVLSFLQGADRVFQLMPALSVMSLHVTRISGLLLCKTLCERRSW